MRGGRRVPSHHGWKWAKLVVFACVAITVLGTWRSGHAIEMSTALAASVSPVSWDESTSWSAAYVDPTGFAIVVFEHNLVDTSVYRLSETGVATLVATFHDSSYSYGSGGMYWYEGSSTYHSIRCPDDGSIEYQHSTYSYARDHFDISTGRSYYFGWVGLGETRDYFYSYNTFSDPYPRWTDPHYVTWDDRSRTILYGTDGSGGSGTYRDDEYIDRSQGISWHYPLHAISGVPCIRSGNAPAFYRFETAPTTQLWRDTLSATTITRELVHDFGDTIQREFVAGMTSGSLTGFLYLDLSTSKVVCRTQTDTWSQEIGVTAATGPVYARNFVDSSGGWHVFISGSDCRLFYRSPEGSISLLSTSADFGLGSVQQYDWATDDPAHPQFGLISSASGDPTKSEISVLEFADGNWHVFHVTGPEAGTPYSNLRVGKTARLGPAAIYRRMADSTSRFYYRLYHHNPDGPASADRIWQLYD